MIRSVKSLEGFEIGAADGTIGKVSDFYFDDEAWAIRYAVVDTSTWLGREVLLSPYSMGEPDWGREVLPVTVTKKQIKNSPAVDTDEPITRQYEKSYLGYYGYPNYWGGSGLWGEQDHPGVLTSSNAGGHRRYLHAPSTSDAQTAPHLRSCNAMTGYHLHANDGEIGHVQGFLVDDHSWSIRFVIVNSSNWWLGHHVLVSPKWIRDANWSQLKLTVNLDRQAIKDAPAYESDTDVGRDAEVSIYNHYSRNGYWQDKREGAVAQHA
jgi:PRC-barrel domain